MACKIRELMICVSCRIRVDWALPHVSIEVHCGDFGQREAGYLIVVHYLKVGIGQAKSCSDLCPLLCELDCLRISQCPSVTRLFGDGNPQLTSVEIDSAHCCCLRRQPEEFHFYQQHFV